MVNANTGAAAAVRLLWFNVKSESRHVEQNVLCTSPQITYSSQCLVKPATGLAGLMPHAAEEYHPDAAVTWRPGLTQCTIGADRTTPCRWLRPRQ